VSPTAVFHHVGLTVSDVDASLRFWRDGLGLTEIQRNTSGPSDEADLAAVVGERGASATGVRLAFEEAGPFALDLYCYSSPPAGHHALRSADVGFVHVAVACDDLEGLIERLLAHGGTPVGEQRIMGGKGCIYMRDPDGHVLELQDRVPRIPPADG
jgi:glyoxylase I family protein